VQIEPKQVGQIAVIAQAVGLQAALEFLVAILTLTTFGVLVVAGTGKHTRSGSVGDHGPTVRALGKGFAFDDGPARLGPRPGQYTSHIFSSSSARVNLIPIYF